MLLNALLIAIKEIRRNILRSILTILGIVIGVASVIAMVMIGDGTTANVTANIEKLGSNMLNVRVGQEKRGAPRDDNSAKPFKIEDITAIKNEVSNLKGVTAENSGMANVVFGNKSNSSLIVGTTNDYFIIKDWEVEQGRIFEEGELSSGKSVCILGTTVVKNLFGDENPIGATIRIKNFPCSVIGVLASKGASSFGRDQDEVVITPLKMYQRKIQGNLDVSSIIVSVMEERYIEDAKEQITSLMQDRRAVKLGESDNFHIRDMKDILNTMTSTTKMLTYLLGSIAAVAFLGGGLGILSSRLGSVAEGSRELGLRLAVGAMQSEVLLQFLIEAIVLSTLGGIIGIFLGLGVGYMVVGIFDLPYIINTQIILISFIFSTLIGVVFGYFPARKAARLNPIDALRYE